MPEDTQNLRGIGDDGDDLHGAATPGADRRVDVVDLLDEPSPCGAALFGGDRELGLRFLRRADAQGWLRLVVLVK
jgi:hypothetical protein